MAESKLVALVALAAQVAVAAQVVVAAMFLFKNYVFLAAH